MFMSTYKIKKVGIFMKPVGKKYNETTVTVHLTIPLSWKRYLQEEALRKSKGITEGSDINTQDIIRDLIQKDMEGGHKNGNS